MAISLGVLSVAAIMACAPTSSTNEIAQVKIADLSFKEVMRQFYSGNMSRAFIGENEIEDLPNIALGSANEDGETTVALMHPVIFYANTAGEPRYLVIIEKVSVYEDGSLVSCHACGATADLYSFKELKDGQFQLVSRTPKNIEVSASNGRIGLNGRDIQDNLNSLGKDLIGSIFMDSYTGMGITSAQWYVLHLPENELINLYELGDAGETNGGDYEEDSPLHYAYEGTFEILPENSTYYPIKLTYKGDKPTEDYEHINRINYSKIVKFDPVKKVYQ